MNPDSITTESQRLIARMQASQKRRYAKGMVLILVAVIAGIIIGAAGTLLYLKKYYHRVPPKPEAIAQAIIDHMHTLLTMTPEEEGRIKIIIDEHLARVGAIRKESFRDSRDVFDRMDAEIEQVLGPDRYKTWDDDKVRRWGMKRHGKGKFGPPGDRKQ